MKSIMFSGSFDPIHEGHLTLISKALEIFEEVIVVVTNNTSKEDQSNMEIRYKQVTEAVKIYKNVKVLINENELTAEFAKKLKIHHLLRGIRNEVDYKYEYEMAKTNKFLNNSLETIFFFAEEKDKTISSTFLREIETLKKQK